MGKTPIAAVWRAMIARCHNEKNGAYYRYGGRGIQVCQRWRESFEAFLADMGPRPSPKHQIDRINNDGNYEPGNCRWATVIVNSRNRSDNNRLTFNGETKTLAEWSEITGIPYGTLWKRLKDGWTAERALTESLRRVSQTIREHHDPETLSHPPE
jgi:hypothetical protein